MYERKKHLRDDQSANGTLDSLMTATPANDSLERLGRLLVWKPLERAWQAMYRAAVVCPLATAAALYDEFGPGLLRAIRWRRFVGLSLLDPVPDETRLVGFSLRLCEHGLHKNLLALINRDLDQKGLIRNTCTPVERDFLLVARRAPGKENPAGGDGDAAYTVKNVRPH